MALFLYGTLMDVDVMAKVLDRSIAECDLTPAVLPGWRRVAVRNATYPVILPDPTARVEGRLLVRPSARDFVRIRHFESEEYLATPVGVDLANGRTILAEVFVALDGVFDLDESGWDLAEWQAGHKRPFLMRCDDWMRDCPALLPAWSHEPDRVAL